MMDRISYNATVRGITMVTPDLMIFQIETDEPRQEFLAGQNMLLGLYGREKRSPNSEPESELLPGAQFLHRPYAIASHSTETCLFEFYISQIKSGQLSPRLFNLKVGDRLHAGDTIKGGFSAQ